MSVQAEINYIELCTVIEETISLLYKDGYVNGALTPEKCKDMPEKLGDAWDYFRSDIEYGGCHDRG